MAEHKITLEEIKYFSTKGKKFTGEKHTIIDTYEDVTGEQVRSLSAKASCLNDISNYRFFTLAPVYIFSRVNEDIVSLFSTVSSYTDHRLFFRFNHVIVANMDVKDKTGTVIGTWSNVLEGLPSTVYEEFKRYMHTQTYYRVKNKEYWEIYSEGVTIPDPIAVDNKASMPPILPVVDVYLPTGNKSKIGLDPFTVDKIVCTLHTPDHQVIKNADVVFGVTLKDKYDLREAAEIE